MSPLLRELRNRYGLALDRRTAQAARDAPDTASALQRVLVSETSFFRHAAQLDALMQVALPERMAARGEEPVQVLSAGCASGAEPASLAILLHEQFPRQYRQKVQFLGIDVNAEALEIARTGIYTPWHLRHVPPKVRSRWFEGTEAPRLLPTIRDTIRYRCDNLLTTPVLTSSRWDVVLCRNVLIHLTPCARHTLLERLIEALRPGGWLLTGPSDLLGFRHPQLEIHRVGDVLLYRRADPVAGRVLGSAEAAFEPTSSGSTGSDIPLRPSLTPEDHPSLRAAGPRSPVAVQVLGSAEAAAPRSGKNAGSRARPPPMCRIRPARPERRRPKAQPSPPPQASLDLRTLAALVAAERHQEVLDRLGADPPPLGEIVRATALLHLGRVDEAEAACWRALAARPDLPEAHHVLSQARSQRGDLGGARDHARATLYLDARFALAHLHAASLAEQVADRAAARRHLLRARSLLPDESEQNVLLFGGGFGRRALLDLCDARLVTVGAP